MTVDVPAALPDLAASEADDSATAPAHVAATQVVDELTAAVLAAGELGSDLLLIDRLESIALDIWQVVQDRLGLPRWSAMASPRHRRVALERSVGRLRQRLDDPRLHGVQVDRAVLDALRLVAAAAGAPSQSEVGESLRRPGRRDGT
jgi:hypothetical protein